MAKKKLTIEDVLVPKEEIPYEVPENWCWVKLGSIAEIVTGNTPAKKNPEYYGTYLPFVKPADLDQGRKLLVSNESLSELGSQKARIIPKYSTAVCCIGSIGKSAFLEVDVATNQQINCVIPNNNINGLYLYYYIQSEEFQKQLWENSSATTISIINKSKMSNLNVCIPPLAEQERIVKRIENIFDKVDKASELVDEARDGFEKRRAAILERAFSGELTKSNISGDVELDLSILSKDFVEFDIPSDIPSNWKWIKFNECCTFLGSGVTPKGGSSVYLDEGTPFIRSQNVLKGSLDMSDEIQDKMKRTTVYSKDTLLNITGASIGRCAYVTDDIKEANVNQHVCILRFKDYIDYKYPSYWINSPTFQNIINKEQIGATRQALNFKQLRGLWIPVPPIEEQRKIVDILDRLMDKEKEISELCYMIDNIDIIKKSILANAFRGELGSNNLDEDNSIDIIKKLI